MKFHKLTSGEMIKLGNELTSEIDRRKELTKKQFIKQGYIGKNERLTYENIDLADLEEELLLLLYNYHKYGHNICNSYNIRILDKVSFAAMCQFIKSKYHIRAYTKDYEELTILDSVLKKSMYEEVIKRTDLNDFEYISENIMNRYLLSRLLLHLIYRRMSSQCWEEVLG